MKIKTRLLVVAAALGMGATGCQAQRPSEWEHGWKTPHVIATRYKSPVIGYNIGFRFPKNPNNCDRAEIFDLIATNNGAVYQGGGFPGAEAFAVFKDVSDKESANKKLQVLLPKLERLMISFHADEN